MRLKSLKLAGFKSFANATTFTFPRGITAIVGPNGCGKSNVIDAIRWVLGETSAKQLRGGAMSDVIFAGTQDKAAKSVASVELTFEHTQDEQTGIRHALNLYQELSVRRQVNLEGRSDYFINGTRCRRRDVIDVFLGTGLGARSYAVIEQGMIGRIVDSNPLQLREFIEEAAGVSRYQARRAETQKKLEKTSDNLARLRDMQSEMERQQKTLSKQAASAQRHHELSESLADIQQQLGIQQLYQAKHTQQQHKIAHDTTKAEVSRHQADYDKLKAKQDRLSASINQKQWLKEDAQSSYYQYQLRLQQAEQAVQMAKNNSQQYEQQLATIEQQRHQATIEIEALKYSKSEQQTLLNGLQPKVNDLEQKRAEHQKNELPLQRASLDAQNELTRLQDHLRALEQQLAINQQAQQRHQTNHDKWLRRQNNWQTLWQQLQGSDDTNIATVIDDNSGNNNDKPDDHLTHQSAKKITALEQQYQQLLRQQDSVTEQIEIAQPTLHNLQRQLAEQQRKLGEHEKQNATLAGEYDTLLHILNPKSPEDTKPLSQSHSQVLADGFINATSDDRCLLHKKSTLREQIELSHLGQAHAAILDKWLGLWLDSDVMMVNDHDLTISAAFINSTETSHTLAPYLSPYLADIRQHQSQRDAGNRGYSHSLWIATSQAGEQVDTFIDIFDVQARLTATLPPDVSDQILSLAALIVNPVLPIWQQCYLYLNDNIANEQNNRAGIEAILSCLPRSALLLTQNGWLISEHGTLNLQAFINDNRNNSDNNDNNDNHGNDKAGNRQFLTQRIAQRSRLQELEGLLADNDAHIETQHFQIKQTQRELDALIISLDEYRAQCTQLSQRSHQVQQQLDQEKARHERWQADVTRLRTDKAELWQEQQELRHEQLVLADEQLALKSDIDDVMPKIAAAHAHRQQLQSARNERNRARQQEDEAWQHLQLSIQKSELQLANSQQNLTRIQDSYEKYSQDADRISHALTQYQANLPELEQALKETRAQCHTQQTVFNEFDHELTALKSDFATQQQQLDSVQENLNAQRRTLADQATELALSEQRLQDTSERLQALSDSINVANIVADFIAHERRVRPDKISALQDEQRILTQRISKLGAVNLAAAAELDELNGRLAPLAQQTADIAASMDTLTSAIASIDATTKNLFIQTLDAVNKALADLFAKVFGGGHASLTLNTDELPANTPKSEQWRAGLTLMAQPKGKRNSRLAVLSGGEKTLTALSLIFAIFKQHPAPFCVLDEVDAPLDDANVARFTSLIYELAEDLQFIFISHNKLAMQIADELKGITMPQPGVSTLVSVSLEDAERYIDSP